MEIDPENLCQTLHQVLKAALLAATASTLARALTLNNQDYTRRLVEVLDRMARLEIAAQEPMKTFIKGYILTLSCRIVSSKNHDK